MGYASKRTFRYEQIAQVIRERIADGAYPIGRLPSERALCTEFAVQRETIRRALRVLRDQDLLVSDTTRGTVVIPSALQASHSALPFGGVLLSVQIEEDMTAPSALFRGLSRYLGEQNVPVFWYDRADKGGSSAPEHQLPSADWLQERDIAGIVLWPRTPAPLLAMRQVREITPLILVDRRVPGFESDFVGFQDFEGGRTVTEHLLRSGHRRVGFLSGEASASSVQARVSGYRAALQAAGADINPRWVLHQEGGSRFLSNETLLRWQEGDGNPLTAVVCANDLVAARLIRSLRGLGRRVPEDVAVTGFGDLMPEMLEAMGITTIAQSFEAMGQAAGQLLLRRWEARREETAPPLPFEERELPVHLIVRETCGAHL